MAFINPRAAISRSGANLVQQAGNISGQAAAQIGRIAMQVAQIRAQGIQEGSEAWSRAMQQIGVTAQNYPLIKQRAEQMEMQREDQRMQRTRFEQDQALQTMREQQVRQQTEINAMNLDNARAAKLELEVSALVANEGITDPLKAAARFKELGHPEYGDKFIKEMRDLQTSRLNMAKAERDLQLADMKALSQIIGPYVNKKEWGDVKTKRAAYMEVLEKGKPFGIDVNSLGPEPTAYADDLLTVAYQRGLTAMEQARLAEGAPPSTRKQEYLDFAENWYLEHPDTPKSTKNEPEIRKAFELSKQAAGGTAIERAFIAENGRRPPLKELNAIEAQQAATRRRPEDEETSVLRKELLRLQVGQAKERGEMTPTDWRGILANVRMLTSGLGSQYYGDLEGAAKALGTTMAEINAGIKGEQLQPKTATPAAPAGGALPPGWTK